MNQKEIIPIKIFWHHIDDAFHAIFPKKLISTLSNMLAIDFTLNNNSSDSPAESKALYCIENIKSYLKLSKENFDESFQSATALFSIALTPPTSYNYVDIIRNIESTKKTDPSSSSYPIESLIHNLVNDQISERYRGDVKIDFKKNISLGRSL